MAQPYVGEIRIFAGNFAPCGWVFCDGRLLSIAENETLFNLIGTTYGGDGVSTFGMPDLRGRLPMHQGAGFVLAQTGGVETVTLTTQQIPLHNHPVLATTSGQQLSPANAIPAQPASTQANTWIYDANNPTVPLQNASITNTGGNQPHTNFQPYLCVNFILSLFGIYPSPT
jgi:microcystin-dependent protein